jgi:hypothetical protein
MSKNQTIKLLKQLIGITTNKKDKAELNLLLKRTDGGQKGPIRLKDVKAMRHPDIDMLTKFLL